MKNPYIYELTMKVRDYECDLQGIVNNANYQHYLEHTRHEFLHAVGASFARLHDEGTDPVVARLTMAFKTPLKSGDEFVSKLYLRKEGIKYVGIIHNRHAFSVALKDLGVFQLLKDDVECEKESDFYLRRECEALNDWECVKRTSRIQELGTDIPLKECEYIPALPMVVAMCYWANRGLNDALEFADGNPLRMDSNYWSVTESSSGYAWNVNFGNGYVSNYYKGGGGSVRPVAAFPL